MADASLCVRCFRKKSFNSINSLSVMGIGFPQSFYRACYSCQHTHASHQRSVCLLTDAVRLQCFPHSHKVLRWGVGLGVVHRGKDEAATGSEGVDAALHIVAHLWQTLLKNRNRWGSLNLLRWFLAAEWGTPEQVWASRAPEWGTVPAKGYFSTES